MTTAEIYKAYMYSYPHKTAYSALSVDFADYRGLLDNLGNLYFHVPFCAGKCGYCNLFSVTGLDADYMDAYVSACETQLRQYGVSSFNGVTIGGGDPLILSPRLLERLLALCGDAEICIEMSPNETTYEKLSLLKQFNTSRISIGVQSFHEQELAALKRGHSAKTAKRALELIGRGFPCVNLDLIYGIPTQTLKSWEDSVKQALVFQPDEIFIYPLYIRNGTKLIESVVNDLAYDMYTLARDFLQASGYFQVSMRKFIKREAMAEVAESPKNCGFENMLAIGCGGRSYLGDLHFCYPYALKKRECMDIINNFIKARDKTEITHGYVLNQDEMKRRFLIKNLLHYRGVHFAEYERAFNGSALREFPVLNALRDRGYAEINESYVKLTPLGLSLSDYIGTMFISDDVKRKMSEWK